MKEKDETTRILNIQVPQEDVDHQFEQATAKIRQEATLPGFRKGKVPVDIVTKKFEFEIREAVLDSLFHESYRDALAQTKCVPIDQPRLEKLDLDRGKPLVYQVVIEVLPKVKLGNYKGMKLKKNKIEIKDPEIETVIERLRHQSAVLEPIENRPAQKGDVVTLAFEGKKDGQVLPGTKSEHYLLELGQGQTIADFETNVEGMQIGETKTFPATFPADYHAKEMAGQVIEFTVNVKSIQTKVLAELNDEFAQQMGKFENLIALQDRIKQDLRAEKEHQNKIVLHDQIMKELSKSTQVKVPDLLVERSLNSLQRDYENRLMQQNQTMEQVGVTVDEFKQKNREQVEQELKARLALREIAQLEQIEVSKADVNAEIERLATSMRQTPEVIRHWVDKNKGWDDIYDRLRDEKTQDFIVEHGKISEN